MVSTEVHFTVRLGMATNGNKCHPLQNWRTSWLGSSDVIQWHSQDGSRILDEHKLDSDSKEYTFLCQWISPNKRTTDRGIFAKVKAPNTKEGLDAYAKFLKGVLNFEQERLAPTTTYPDSRKKKSGPRAGSAE
jgi:hypothetical protein